MANITGFKLVGDSKTITKVRVSMDNGNTWGVLWSKVEQGQPYYVVSQNGKAYLDLKPDENNSCRIDYTIYLYDTVDGYIGVYDTGFITSNYHDYNNTKVGTAYETYYVNVNGENIPFEAEIIITKSNSGDEPDEPTEKTETGIYIYDAYAEITDTDFYNDTATYKITHISIKYKYSDGSVDSTETYTGQTITGTCPMAAESVVISGFKYGGFTAPNYTVYFQ